MTAALLSALLSLPWWAPASMTWATGIPRWDAASSDDRAGAVGLWDVVAVELNGVEIDAELVALLRIAYRADGSWTVLFRTVPLAEGTSTIDERADPKTFEMQTLAGEKSKPHRYTGIYRLDGDTRLLCFVESGMPRPDTFTAPRGSGRVLVTLRRAAER